MEGGELLEVVHIKFDDESTGPRFKDCDRCIPIPPLSASFHAHIPPLSASFYALRSHGDVERRLLFLILSWAVTVHKLQDTTL